MGEESTQTDYELYYLVARDRLTNQINQIDQVDEKLGEVLGVATIILPLTAGLIVRDGATAETLSSSVQHSLLAASASYAGLFVAFFLGYRVGEWDDRPDLNEFKENLERFKLSAVHEWYGDGCSEAFGGNAVQYAKKANHLQLAIWFLAGEVFFLMLAILLLLFD